MEKLPERLIGCNLVTRCYLYLALKQFIMTPRRFSLLTVLLLAVAAAWWAAILLSTLGPNKPERWLRKGFPRAYGLFHNNWRLFTPPPLGNDRLYLLLQDEEKPGCIDTIEVLQPLIQRKIQTAPFNQPALIEDNMLENTLLAAERLIAPPPAIPTNDFTLVTPNPVDWENPAIKHGTAPLYAYAWWWIKRHHYHLDGKRIGIRLTRVPIPPRKSPEASYPEQAVFSLPYKKLAP